MIPTFNFLLIIVGLVSALLGGLIGWLAATYVAEQETEKLLERMFSMLEENITRDERV